jgi:hypothetical protein
MTVFSNLKGGDCEGGAEIDGTAVLAYNSSKYLS